MIHTLLLPMPPPMRSANAYLIEGDELTLVDTGPKSERVWEALVAALAAKGLHVADIGQVVLTHPHLDHFGLSRRIAEESGAKVLVHRQGTECVTDYEADQVRLESATASRLRQADAPDAAWDILRLRTSMNKHFAESVPAGRVAPLEDGQTLSLGGMPWQALSTPGHCLGHICLYQADSGRLISGDCLLPGYQFVPVPYPVPTASSDWSLVSAFSQSLELLGRLDVRELLPGHGPTRYDASALIAREQANLAKCRERLWSALANRRQTAYQLWRECGGPFHAFDVLTGTETVGSYLDAMQGEGTVAAWQEGDRVTYSRIE